MRWTSKVSFWFREIDVVSIVRGRGQGNYIGAVKDGEVAQFVTQCC